MQGQETALPCPTPTAGQGLTPGGRLLPVSRSYSAVMGGASPYMITCVRVFHVKHCLFSCIAHPEEDRGDFKVSVGVALGPLTQPEKRFK